MKNFKHWMTEKLFNLLSRLSPTEQPTADELRAWAREEVQKPPELQIWYDSTVRSYPQQRTDPLQIPPHRSGQLGVVWHRIEKTGAHPTFTGVLKRIRMEHDDHIPEQPLDPKTDFPPWLNSAISVKDMTPEQIATVPTIRDLTPEFDPYDTRESPAVIALLHQERQERRARQAG